MTRGFNGKLMGPERLFSPTNCGVSSKSTPLRLVYGLFGSVQAQCIRTAQALIQEPHPARGCLHWSPVVLSTWLSLAKECFATQLLISGSSPVSSCFSSMDPINACSKKNNRGSGRGTFGQQPSSQGRDCITMIGKGKQTTRPAKLE